MGSQPALSPSPQSPPRPPLPPQPSLEHLRKQAKDLVAAARAGEHAALERVARFFPALAPSPSEHPVSPDVPPLKLTQAQLVIAREHGFSSWARLRRELPLVPLRAQVERLVVRDWRLRGQVMRMWADAGPAGSQVAIEALSHPHPLVRRGALDYIDHHATDSDVPRLLDIARNDPVPYVRRTAIHALICERCKPVPLQVDPLPILLDAFCNDPTPRVRFTAGQSLWRLYRDSPGVREAFQAAAENDPSGLVRGIALGCLPRVTRLQVLVNALQHDDDARVRIRAAWGLRGVPRDPQAVEALEAAVRNDPDPIVRREAHRSLKHQSPEYWQRAAQRAREANLARAREQARDLTPESLSA